MKESFFRAYPIVRGDAVYRRIYGKSYRENRDIRLEDLRYLRMLHYNFSHRPQEGEMIVNRAIAGEVLAIFEELFAHGYEICSMYLIDRYWVQNGIAADSASVEANNTSCFNYRRIAGSDMLSFHAYGYAIDINPQQNPYVWYENGAWRWEHKNASPYIDRSGPGRHMIAEGDICHRIFTRYGYDWGGSWDNPKDYQHFCKWKRKNSS